MTIGIRRFRVATMNKHPTIIDVFAGVGGLSLGAARAGFAVAGAIELDKLALATHARNFPRTAHLQEDVAKLSGKDLLSTFGLEPTKLAGLVGGPPCQGFSDIGRRNISDPRNSLFVAFFRLVRETHPAFFIAENVPGVLDARNRTIRERAISLVPKRYTVLEPIAAHANKYGAPTTRTRVLFIGFDPDRLAPLHESDFVPDDSVQDVRVRDAFRGLPLLRSHWNSEDESWRAVGPLGDSQYESRIKDAVPPGVGDPDALRLLAKKRLVSGFLGTQHSKETTARFAAVAQGEREPISRFPRLHRDGYCPTLRAGTGPDKGSYQAVRPIHPTSPRVISPREGARLQGFPDWFQFHPTKWHSFRQIGNSVSPLVAESILRVMRRSL